MISGLSQRTMLYILTRWLINISLVMSLGYQVTAFMLSWTDTQPPQIMPTLPTPQTSQTMVDITTIINARLFGTATTARAYPTAPPPETKLNLKLHGIYYATDGSSFAIIADNNGKHRLYRQGATLAHDTTLQEIHPKEVVLTRAGRQEILKLSGASVQQTTTAVTENIAAATKSQEEHASPSQLLARYQQQLRENPQKLLSLVRVEPVEQEGKFTGFRLTPGRDATLFNRFDLKTGDILIAVNGTSLDSPLKGLSLVEQLGQTKQLNLTVLRQGQPMSLSFSID